MSTTTKTRNSNIELLRIISMLLVLGLHVNYLALGKVTIAGTASEPLLSLVRMEFESLCIVCVNLYVLISGYFGIRIKKKSLIGLLFTILFWQISLYTAGIIDGRYTLDFNLLQKMIIPGGIYWFVPAYLMLVLLSPMLNAYIEKTSKKNMGRFIICFLAVQTIFGYVQPYWNMFINGYSAISFIGLYLIGSYIRKYSGEMFRRGAKSYVAVYVLAMTIAAVAAFLTYRYADSQYILPHVNNWFLVSYISPFAIIGAVSLFVAFTRTGIKNNVWINRIAASAFPVYLIHIHPVVVIYFLRYARYIYNSFDGILYIVTIIAYIVGVYLLCTLLDQIRILAWKWCCKLFRI